jgi:hypothetical protein
MRYVKRSVRFFLFVLAALIALISGASSSHAQGLEVSGGWSHITQDFGTDGFQVGAGWRFSRRIAVVANYDDTWDVSRVGTFEFTSVGAIASKSHLQNFLVGPRYYFAPQRVDKKKYRIDPFAEGQFGVSRLNSKIQQGTQPFVSHSDDGFSWMLGGGADYNFTPHWGARGNLDLLRTHLNEEGQSRLRIVLGIVYSFGERGY